MQIGGRMQKEQIGQMMQKQDAGLEKSHCSVDLRSRGRAAVQDRGGVTEISCDLSRNRKTGRWEQCCNYREISTSLKYS